MIWPFTKKPQPTPPRSPREDHEKIFRDIMHKHGVSYTRTDAVTTIALHTLFPNIGQAIKDITDAVNTREMRNQGLLQKTRSKLRLNKHHASKADPYDANAKLIEPTDHKAIGKELIELYLKDTPFHDYFLERIPWQIPADRTTHVLMIAPTGSGKSQWIQQDVYAALKKKDPPGMVVIDSQNQMIPKLERLEIARDRLIIIDPLDDPPPALNFFISHKRNLSKHAQEVVEAQTLHQFTWMFSALDQELTGRMPTLFSFTVRTLLAMAPNSNLRTFRDLLRIEKISELKGSPFWRYIENTDEDTIGFFVDRFCTADYNRTKAAIADRLYSILRVPAFARMFLAPDNRLDMYEALKARKLILFNTRKRALQADASAILGRYAIAMYIKTAFEREDDPNPPPAFLYVDEASEYFGKKDNSDTLFTQLRKFNCGTFVGFQELGQLAAQTSVLMANTSTKIVSRLEAADAGNLADTLRMSAAELMQSRKEPDRFNMQCFVKDHMTRGVSFSFPYGIVENAPQLDDVEHFKLRYENSRRIGTYDDYDGPDPFADYIGKPKQKAAPVQEPPARPTTEATGIVPDSLPSSDNHANKAIKPGKKW